MAYTRLNVKDLIDKWDAAKVNHLENGIVNNETEFNSFKNGNSSDSVYENFVNQSGINVYSNIYTLNNLLAFPRDMGDFGKHYHEPHFSYNGDMTGKEIITIPDKVIDTMCSNMFSEIMCSYIKISDEIISNFAAFSYGGSEEFFSGLMLFEEISTDYPLSISDVLAQAQYARSTVGTMAISEENAFYSILRVMDEEQFEIGKELNSMIFGHFTDLTLPDFFSIDHDFEYQEKIFPKGTYVINIWGDLSGLTIPLYYVNNIWDFSRLGSPANNKFYWNELNFTSKNVLTFNGNEILWDGVSSFASNISNVTKVSTDALKFYNGIKDVKTFIIKYSDGTQYAALLKNFNDVGFALQLANNTQDIAVFIPLTLFSENSTTMWAPGVYFNNYSDKYISNIICLNTNVEEYFSQKLPEKYYDHLGGEKTQLQLNSQSISNSSQVQSISINFSSLNSEVKSGAHSYTKISNDSIDLASIAAIVSQRDETLRHMHIEDAYETGNVSASFTLMTDTVNRYIVEGTTFPDSGVIRSSIYVDHYPSYNSCDISYYNYAGLKGTLRISQVRGPSLLNPGDRHNSTLSVTNQNSTYTVANFNNIKVGSWIDIEYTPAEEERGAAIPTDFALIINFSSSTVNFYNTIIPNNINWSSYQIVPLMDEVEGLIVESAESEKYCILLNVSADKTIAGVNCTKGLYSLFNDAMGFVNQINFQDYYLDSEIKTIDPKFMPEIPTYNLAMLGLPAITTTEFASLVLADTDTYSQMRNSASKGPVKLIVNTDGFGEISLIATFAFMEDTYQCCHTGYYGADGAHYNLVINFGPTTIQGRLYEV